ncbi:hypothetical protein J3E71DRAFT_344549 [Bipolaris maydis]|nr:hypothetical protein J3E73DRAFT_372891 [Bipolaris maydis]KAJ6279900.1 hypothetical protein J3E71DRAFT_344549 [Bipolaris maydis]
MDMTKFTSLYDVGFVQLQGVLSTWIKQAKSSKTLDANFEVREVPYSATMPLNNSTTEADTLHQATTIAGRDMNLGNVTHQNMGRD